MAIYSNLIFWALVFISYFATRLINLTIIPIFTDEAIYSYWAQVALHDPANRFISLEDGKQPLFIWLAAIFQKFVSDPLIATRLVSTAAGLGSLIGIYLLSKELFNQKVAALAAFLYVILPFTLLYDRMALFDSLLTMFGIYAILFSVRLAKKPKLELALLSGLAIGAAMITKSSGNFFLYLLPFTLILAGFGKKTLKAHILKWTFFAAITFLISQIIYNSLRLSPLFYIIGRKNLEFIRSLSEALMDPFAFTISNFITLTGWIITYLGPLLFLIFIGSLLLGLFRKNLKIVYLSILIFAPFFAMVIFNKVIYPRFMLFYFPYVIILIAHFVNESWNKFKNKLALAVVLSLALIFPIINSFWLIFEPTRTKIPSSDAGQYLNDWPAGYGIRQVVDFIKSEDQNKQIYVGTEGTFGLLPFALQIYFFGQNNVHVIGFWPVDENKLPVQITEAAKNNPTYFVFNENQKDITNSRLRLIDKFQKGIGNSYMRLYQIIPQ